MERESAGEEKEKAECNDVGGGSGSETEIAIKYITGEK